MYRNVDCIIPCKRLWVLTAQVHKNKKGGCGCTEEVLEQFNYTHASTHHRCEVSYQGCTESTWIVALLMHSQGQANREESCIVLESGPTSCLIAKQSQHLSLELLDF